MEKTRYWTPKRLSVDERIDYAVQEAVRRTLEEQRKTQERELDTLSDALQRSLAALAGERDRALRALASEERKKRKIVDDLSILLGEELTAGQITRLAMGLDGLQLEKHGRSDAGQAVEEDSEDEPYGRTWVLQQLRQCLHAHASAQERLRALDQELADERFEADDLFVGGGCPTQVSEKPPVCPPGSGATVPGMPEGVARARFAASEALLTSLNHARDRVEQLEKLVAEVGIGYGAGDSSRSNVIVKVSGKEASTRGVTELSSGGAVADIPVDVPSTGSDTTPGSTFGVDDAPLGCVIGVQDSAGEAGGLTDVESDALAARGVRDDFPLSREPEPQSAQATSGLPDAVVVASETAAYAATAGLNSSAGMKTTDLSTTQDKDAVRALGDVNGALRENWAARLIGSPGCHSDVANDASSAPDSGGRRGRGVHEPQPARTLGRDQDAATGIEVLEGTLWRLASGRAEASTADLHETLGSVLTLAFRCGEEHARQLASNASSTGSSADKALCGDARDVGHKREGGQDEDGALLGERFEKGEEHRLSKDVVASTSMQQGRGSPPLTNDQGLDAPRNGLGSEEIGCVTEIAGQWCETENGERRCITCDMRGTAIRELLGRLEAKSVEQGKDLAKMEALLQLLQSAAPGEPHVRLITAASGAPSAKQQGLTLRAVESQVPQAVIPPVLSAGEGGRKISQVGAGEEENGGAKEARVAAGERRESTEGPPYRRVPSTPPPVDPKSADREEGAGMGGMRDSRRRDVRTEWQELETLDMSPAIYGGMSRGAGGSGGLGSPVVQGILDRWIDVGKRRILEGWLAHVLHGGSVDSANGCFVPRVQISSLSKEVRDGLVSVVLPLLLHRRGVLLQVLTRERVELVHDIQLLWRNNTANGDSEVTKASSYLSLRTQIRVTPVTGRRDAPLNARATGARRRAPMGEREHGARIRDMVMKAAHAGYVEEDEPGGEARAWTPLGSVDNLSRQLRDTWDSFSSNLSAMTDRGVGSRDTSVIGGPLPEYG